MKTSHLAFKICLKSFLKIDFRGQEIVHRCGVCCCPHQSIPKFSCSKQHLLPPWHLLAGRKWLTQAGHGWMALLQAEAASRSASRCTSVGWGAWLCSLRFSSSLDQWLDKNVLLIVMGVVQDSKQNPMDFLRSGIPSGSHTANVHFSLLDKASHLAKLKAKGQGDIFFSWEELKSHIAKGMNEYKETWRTELIMKSSSSS